MERGAGQRGECDRIRGWSERGGRVEQGSLRLASADRRQPSGGFRSFRNGIDRGRREDLGQIFDGGLAQLGERADDEDARRCGLTEAGVSDFELLLGRTRRRDYSPISGPGSPELTYEDCTVQMSSRFQQSVAFHSLPEQSTARGAVSPGDG